MSEYENGSALALDEVVRRFSDSEQALNKARQELEALAAAEQTQAAAARGLTEASSTTAEFAKAAQALVAGAEETLRVARDVLQAGAGLIEGTDLKELQRGLSSMASAINEGFERIEKLVGDVSERDQRIAELETDLARRTAVLHRRQRKGLGIE